MNAKKAGALLLIFTAVAVGLGNGLPAHAQEQTPGNDGPMMMTPPSFDEVTCAITENNGLEDLRGLRSAFDAIKNRPMESVNESFLDILRAAYTLNSNIHSSTIESGCHMTSLQNKIEKFADDLLGYAGAPPLSKNDL